MFVKRPEERIRLYINYRLFNIITKKDCYLILLVKKNYS
jgi:hypothetical protein